jgi:hypothetical protein
MRSPRFVVPGGYVSVRYSSRASSRALYWLLMVVAEALGIGSPPEGEGMYVVICNDQGSELHREGPYMATVAVTEAQRYAKLIELSGMDRALRTIQGDGTTGARSFPLY